MVESPIRPLLTSGGYRSTVSCVKTCDLLRIFVRFTRDPQRPRYVDAQQDWLGSWRLRRGVCRSLTPCIHPPVADLGAGCTSRVGDVRRGDFMLFVASFTILALVRTALALFFLRPYEKFWLALSVVALAIAITGPIGALLSALIQPAPMQSGWGMAAEFGFLRATGAPLLVIAFLTFAAFAPSRRTRWSLLVATGLECVASAYFVGRLLLAHP